MDRNIDRNTWDQILYCAIDIGERLLRCGAEVHRVEDSIQRICTAYGAKETDVFSITSSIVVTVHVKEMETITQSRRVSTAANDLMKLDEYNALSRWVCENTPDPHEIHARIQETDERPGFPLWLQYFAWAFVSASFTVFFGGTIQDGLAASLIGIVLKCLADILPGHTGNSLMTALLWSAAGGLLAELVSVIPMPFVLHPDLISIGNIMLFIPGVAFTNALRDLFLGDTITGLIRLMESVILAVVIALGFSASGLLIHPGISTPHVYDAWIQIAMAGIGSLGFSIVFHADQKQWPYLVLGGMLCWVVYLLADAGWSNDILAAFLASGAVGIFAEAMARLRRTPAVVFSLIGAIPLIPGAGLYRTFATLLAGNAALFKAYGTNTLLIAAAMSAGIIFFSPLGKTVIRLIERIFGKNP